MSSYAVTYGSDSVVVELGGNPNDPILLDGVSTGRQIADGRCEVDACLRIAAAVCWGPIYDTEDDALTDGPSPGVDNITIWDDVSYQRLDAT